MSAVHYPSLLHSLIAHHDELQRYRSHAPSAKEECNGLERRWVRDGGGGNVVVNGHALSLAGLVASARYSKAPLLDASPEVRRRIDAAVQCVSRKLEAGESLYGINTGFGGSADSRTPNTRALQLALLQHQQCGILPVPSRIPRPAFGAALPLSDEALSQPEAWVRGAMVIRLNSLMRGHSGVRWEVLERMQALLSHNVTPVVPLRGSISASGDLSPLSYVAGCLAGQPGIFAWVDEPSGVPGAAGVRRVKVPSCDALRRYGIAPTRFEPKEALGILNGTAFSASVAGLALHDAQFLCFLTQATTAMAVEAELATDGCFDSFVHATARPHPGQVECAATILELLRDSRLATHGEASTSVTISEDDGHLRQSRYPLRTAAQWLGPQVEDLLSAASAVQLELNATTDNPLIDAQADQIHHGGNFQAMAVTNAMEKARVALAACGKLTFQQLTELINPAMSCGLPANLAATDPSLNFHCKGIDIATAALCAELGYLANPVSTHVQSAEMGNQAVNSMALCSARYTVRSVECLAHILAWALYALCQALDLRALQHRIAVETRSEVRRSIDEMFSAWIDAADRASLSSRVSGRFRARLDELSARDLDARLHEALMGASGEIIDYFGQLPSGGGSDPLRAVLAWREHCAARTGEVYRRLTREFLERPNACHASPLLGRTAALYEYVRRTLGVPMHGLDNYHAFATDGEAEEGTEPFLRGESIGGHVSVIYEAISNGELFGCLVDMARQVAPSVGGVRSTPADAPAHAETRAAAMARM